MKKYYTSGLWIIALLMILTVSFSARAQYSLGASVSYNIAVDDLAKGANNGVGVTIEGRRVFDDFLKAGINISYISFGNKNTDSKISPLIDGNALSIIPVTLTAQVSFSDNKLKPYLGLDLGWATANLGLMTDSKNYIFFGPSFGMEYALKEQISLHAEVKDNLMVYKRLNSGYDLLSFIGISIGGAYKF